MTEKTDFKTEKSAVRRQAKRGKYDEKTLHSILDEGFLCHVGFSVDGQPFVIPTLYGREGNTIYIHGSAVSRMLKEASEGVELCLTVTHVDGIVLARSAFHHSMNYRSAVVFGKGRLIEDDDKKNEALFVISEQLLEGRWDDSREPTKKELDVTSVIAVDIEEASCKIREGDPSDDKKDYELPIWAGVLPFETKCGEPIPDSLLSEGIEEPDYLRKD